MPVPPAPEAPSPITASRVAWQRYLVLGDEVPAETLAVAVTDVPSRDALLLLPYLSTWDDQRTLHRDLWALDPDTVREAVTRCPDDDLLARVTDGVRQVLDHHTLTGALRQVLDHHEASDHSEGTPAARATITGTAGAFATLAHLSWTARDYAAAREHTNSALGLRPEHSLAVVVAGALDAGIEPEWALAPRLRGPAASFAVPQ